MKKIKSFLRGLLLFLIVIGGIALWLMAAWWGVLAAAALLALWMALTRRGRQAGSVTQVGVSTIRQRLGASSVIVIGIAGVVGVLVAMLAMAEGYRETLRKSGSEDSAIVLRGASAAEVMSTLDRATVTVVEQAPGVARDSNGRPVVTSELVVAANLPLKGGGPDEDGSVQLRGVGPQSWSVRRTVKIVEGRKFE